MYATRRNKWNERVNENKKKNIFANFGRKQQQQRQQQSFQLMHNNLRAF